MGAPCAMPAVAAAPAWEAAEEVSSLVAAYEASGSAVAGGASAPVSALEPPFGRRLEELQALFSGFHQAGAILRFETYCQSTPPLGTRGAPSAREGRL